MCANGPFCESEYIFPQAHGIFFAISLYAAVVTISIGYPWAKKKFKTDVKQVPTMEETYIGKTMTAEEDMGETSLINVSGIYWTACNKGKIIKKGEEFTITGLEGTKLIVKLKEN